MNIFELMSNHQHEEVVFGYDRDAKLRAIIAIHNTTLGPALGGTRLWPYHSEAEALQDVLRLSRGMTYKAALAGLNLGGGKAVIIADPDKDKNEILFRAFGRVVEGLHGRYITAEDVGTSVLDMEQVRSETNYVVGISESLGGSGDPSPVTARGVYFGIKAAAEEVFQNKSLNGLSVAIQGFGHVGRFLAEFLHQEGARLYVTDIHEDRLEYAADQLGAEVVKPDAIYDVKADVFAPCALGAIVNDETIDRMQFRIIAGAANNQLAHSEKHGQVLHDRGVLYAPDYVINAGGLINVANELEGYNRDRALKQAEGIYSVVREIIQVSKDEGIPPHAASDRIALRRIEQVGKLTRRFITRHRTSYRRARLFD